MVWDNAGWLGRSRRAAADRPPSSTTATNARISRSSMVSSHWLRGGDATFRREPAGLTMRGRREHGDPELIRERLSWSGRLPVEGHVDDFTAPEVTADDHMLGPAGAPVTIVEYGDYECPYCRGAARDVDELLGHYPGMILFVFRNFPIPQLHPHAEQAAQAAEAAAAQGKFWQMYELLLRPACGLDFDSLLGYAEHLDLDTSRFSYEVNGDVYATRIERDVEEGIRNGVNATPKFYVDGERIDGKVPLEGLVEAVEAVLGPSRRDDSNPA
jgi:protein-disulfide isomerase